MNRTPAVVSVQKKRKKFSTAERMTRFRISVDVDSGKQRFRTEGGMALRMRSRWAPMALPVREALSSAYVEEDMVEVGKQVWGECRELVYVSFSNDIAGTLSIF